MKSFGVMFGALACAVTLAFASADNPLTLWYNSDAGTEFTNALPIGNGYMGGIKAALAAKGVKPGMYVVRGLDSHRSVKVNMVK